MTLVETLIGALIFAFVTAGVYGLYTTMQNTMNRGELMSDLQQNARIGLAQMVQEIRMTGYDPSGIIPLISSTTPPKAAIRSAMPGCFSFVADWQGDGTADQITYTVGTSDKCVSPCLRRKVENWDSGNKVFSGGGGFQPLAGGTLVNVSTFTTVSVLAFTYYDANNQVLDPTKVPPSTRQCPPSSSAGASVQQLTFDQMRLIHRVAITLKVQGSRPGVFPQFFTLTSDVRLRNF
jgi:Tfp pilus assembly protein PilW